MKLKIYDSIENIKDLRENFLKDSWYENEKIVFEILTCGSVEITAEKGILEKFENYITSTS